MMSTVHGCQTRRTHRGLLHGESVSVLGPGPAADRRGSYKIVDGTMTNCRLPKPDWQLIAHAINVANNQATTKNTLFKFLGIPVFYLPYLRHPVDDTGRRSGLMIPIVSNTPRSAD